MKNLMTKNNRAVTTQMKILERQRKLTKLTKSRRLELITDLTDAVQTENSRA